MDSRLQEAIDATRAGEKEEAQHLLAELLQENPEEVQAWYLLSLLVDSEQKQVAYLSKTLAVDANHVKAKERLAKLQVVPAGAGEIDAFAEDLLAQEQGVTLPDWLSEEDGVDGDSDTAVADVPDWVQEDLSSSWVTQETPTMVGMSVDKAEEKTAVAKATPPTPAKTAVKPDKPSQKQKKKKPAQSAQRLNMLLGLLIVCAIAVAVLLLLQLF